jgi:hypothetical protein
VTDVGRLVGLLQRADWTRLSLSADVNDGSTVLVAPGMRYRYQTEDYLTGCDGARPWELSEDEDDHDNCVHWISSPTAPLNRMLCPAWLLQSSQLELRGRTRAYGRDAFDVVMTRRPTLRTRPVSAGHVAATIGGLAAGALGAWIKYSPLRRARSSDADGSTVENAITRDEPTPDSSLARAPLGDYVLELLHAGGPAELAASLRQWIDIGALAAAVPDSARRAGLGGLGFLADAISEQPTTRHTVSAIRLAGLRAPDAGWPAGH